MGNLGLFTILKRVSLLLFIVFALIYIGYDLYSDFKAKYINQSYLSGKTDVISMIIKEAEKPECQPVSVYNEQKTVQLININCLKGQNQ